MWLWESELRHWGFRKLSARYWQCEGRYGLLAGDYISMFSHANEKEFMVGAGRRVDMSAFHVTFRLGADHIHFYFHELNDGVWEPGGHTSSGEIRRYHKEPAELLAAADRIAAAFLSANDLMLLAREE